MSPLWNIQESLEDKACNTNDGTQLNRLEQQDSCLKALCQNMNVALLQYRHDNDLDAFKTTIKENYQNAITELLTHQVSGDETHTLIQDITTAFNNSWIGKDSPLEKFDDAKEHAIKSSVDFKQVLKKMDDSDESNDISNDDDQDDIDDHSM